MNKTTKSPPEHPAGVRRLDSSRISPTAHFTGYSWVKYGFSDQALATNEGAALYWLLFPFDKIAGKLVHISLESFLYARHALIDSFVDDHIKNGGFTTVLEIASGLSGRGHRFTNRYRHIHWYELDLPGMSESKLDLLQRNGKPDNLHCIAGNALDTELFKKILPAKIGKLDKTLVITEGLLNYLNDEELALLWKNIAMLKEHAGSLQYFSDLHPQEDNSHPVIQMGRTVLSWFVKGRVNFHFKNESDFQKFAILTGAKEAKWHHPAEYSEITKVHPQQYSPVRIVSLKY